SDLAAIARSAGFLVASVVDLFNSGDARIAVLDTSINHMPEVFEYQWQPPVASSSGDGRHSYLLAGASCLAGDLFGKYRFDDGLHVGSRVVFTDIGAYSMVKANMFNGINLPNLYLLHEGGRLELIKRFEFDDFFTLCGAENATGP
ncbi:MAG: 2Fe-2S ferredoxin, partial [Candidatus Thiodiazotropha sp.]